VTHSASIVRSFKTVLELVLSDAALALQNEVLARYLGHKMVAPRALANAILVESGRAALATYQFSTLSRVADDFTSVALRVVQSDKLLVLAEDRKDFLRMNDLRFSLPDLDGLIKVVLRVDLSVFNLLTFSSVGAPRGALIRLIIVISASESSSESPFRVPFFLKNVRTLAQPHSSWRAGWIAGLPVDARERDYHPSSLRRRYKATSGPRRGPGIELSV
jgi:hypothetical protein